ncbi:hypothetical protein BDV10DRAFT_23091 [Aspergillus recurvatus]
MSQPADTTSKKPRRFLPEPIEISSRSSKNRQDNRFRNQNLHPVQTGFRTSKIILNSSINENPGEGSHFPPWQTGLSPRSIRKHDAHDFTAIMYSTTSTQTVAVNQQGNAKRYTPQLMETVRHSFRPGKKPVQFDGSAGLETQSSRDAIEAADRMEADHDAIRESRFSYSSLLRRQETRRHSFRVPDLPAIPSSGSEGSNESNSPRIFSPTFATTREILSDDSARPRNGRESSDEYILPLPRHRSENQLKEQALAAFPNEQVYQQVDHFAIDRDEEESVYEECINIRDPELEFRTSRRASSADLPSELEYLRKHKEEAGMNRRHYLTTRGACSSTPAAHRSSRNSEKPAYHDDGWDINSSLTRLRQVASPPMLGGDLIFPQSLTPKTTICERPNGVYGGHHDFSSLSGLWSSSPRSSAQYDIGGLWNGTCKLDLHPTHGIETLSRGLATPKRGVEDDGSGHLDESFKASDPPHRSPQYAMPSSRNDSNNSECIDQEFNDAFVTQIYDYLSLGYPSIARYYDHELSKVSGLPVAALRADDLNLDAKGHVGVHDITNRGAVNGVCMRWTALKLYVHEWARQHPCMLDAGRYHETWGVRERKGSWAV